jgi:hypothetical protein
MVTCTRQRLLIRILLIEIQCQAGERVDALHENGCAASPAVGELCQLASHPRWIIDPTISNYLWWRVWSWLLRKHPRTGKHAIWVQHHVRRWPQYNGVRLYSPTTMRIQRYRYRGSQIPTPRAIIDAVPA